MAYQALTDEQWRRLQPIVLRCRRGPRTKQSDRAFVDAVLYRATMRIAWSELPRQFGPWQTIYNRLWKWNQRGLWRRVLHALQLKVDRHGFLVDGDAGVRAANDEHTMSLDHQLRELADAAQALATTRDVPPCLVIGELDVPGMPGGELTTHFLTEPTLSRIPVLVISGYLRLSMIENLIDQRTARASDGDAAAGERDAAIESPLLAR